MIALLLAIVAGYGVHLVYSSVAFGWDGLQPGPPAPETNASGKSHFIEDLGLGEFDARSLVAAIAVLALMGFTFGIVLFNGIIAGVLLGMFAATVPVGVARIRHEQTINLAHQEWPSLIEEIRLLTGSLGRSIPQATFEVGLRSGDGLRPAFEEAHREWTISTDFNRSMRVLKAQLAHNTADIRGNNTHILAVKFLPNIGHKNGRGAEVINGDIKEPLNLSRMKFKCQDAIRTGSGDQIGDQFCRNRCTTTRLTVLAGIAEIWHHSRNSLC